MKLATLRVNGSTRAVRLDGDRLVDLGAADLGELFARDGWAERAAAVDAGAEAFLAPVDNCGEALDGGVPGDLPVYAVATLDEALTAIETLAAGQDPGALPTCQSALGG